MAIYRPRSCYIWLHFYQFSTSQFAPWCFAWILERFYNHPRQHNIPHFHRFAIQYFIVEFNQSFQEWHIQNQFLLCQRQICGTTSFKTWHVLETFFIQVHFFNSSSNRNISRSNQPRNSPQIICHYCGILGHKAPDCRKKNRDQSGTSKGHVNNFTWWSIIFIHNHICIPTPSPSWYLDSGASQHMSPLRSLFLDYQELASLRIILLSDNSSNSAVVLFSMAHITKSGIPAHSVSPGLLFLRSHPASTQKINLRSDNLICQSSLPLSC